MKQNTAVALARNPSSRQYRELASVYDFLVAEASETCSTTADKILGAITIFGVTAGGWLLIVLLLSHFID